MSLKFIDRNKLNGIFSAKIVWFTEVHPDGFQLHKIHKVVQFWKTTFTVL